MGGGVNCPENEGDFWERHTFDPDSYIYDWGTLSVTEQQKKKDWDRGTMRFGSLILGVKAENGLKTKQHRWTLPQNCLISQNCVVSYTFYPNIPISLHRYIHLQFFVKFCNSGRGGGGAICHSTQDSQRLILCSRYFNI